MSAFECRGCRGEVTAHLEDEPARRLRGVVSVGCKPCGWQGEPYRTLSDAYGGASVGGWICAAFNRSNVLRTVVGVMRRLKALGHPEQARGALAVLAALHFTRKQICDEGERQDKNEGAKR